MSWLYFILAIIALIMRFYRPINPDFEYENTAIGLLEIDNGGEELENLRSQYAKMLNTYYKNNTPKYYLINNFCEARLVKDKLDVYFYVKERFTSVLNGSYFEVRGNIDHVYTMWGIIDMEFNKLKNYGDLRSLYMSLNQGYNTTGGLKYFNEPRFNKLPKPIKNKTAQNEYCRMEIETIHGETVIVCSEIWGTPKYDKPKKFVIQGNKHSLYKIINSFAKKINKKQNYDELFREYIMRRHCSVLTPEEFEESTNKQKSENIIQKPEQPEYKTESTENKNINNNYGERKLDL